MICRQGNGSDNFITAPQGVQISNASCFPPVFHYNDSIVAPFSGPAPINSMSIQIPKMEFFEYISPAYKFTSQFKNELQQLFDNIGSFAVYVYDENDVFVREKYFNCHGFNSIDYRQLFIQKLCYTVFGNIQHYFDAKKRDGFAFSDEEYAMSRTIHGAFMPLSGSFPCETDVGGITSRTVLNDECFKTEITNAIAFYRNFKTGSANDRILSDCLAEFEAFINCVLNIDSSCFTALYKIECPILESNDAQCELFVSLFEHLHNTVSIMNELDNSLRQGLHFEIEWKSAGEREIIRIFSLVYHNIMPIEPEWKTKNIILMFDEPETHLHPASSEKFIIWLEEAVRLFLNSGHILSAQVIISTHSPLVIKQCYDLPHTTLRCVEKSRAGILVYKKQLRPLLRVTSYAEILYRFFDVVTSEFHDELYGAIIKKIATIYNASIGKIKEREIDCFLRGENVRVFPEPWDDDRSNKPPYSRTLCVYLRNYIHHPENEKNATIPRADFEMFLRESITEMDRILRNP